MIDGRGQVRLTDFGLATAIGAVEDVRAGTPAYQAPEQLAGREVTARSDLFALGLVLFEVFTGRRAFPAATPRGVAAARTRRGRRRSRRATSAGSTRRWSGRSSVAWSGTRPTGRGRRTRSWRPCPAATRWPPPWPPARRRPRKPSPTPRSREPCHPLVAAALLVAILFGIYGVARLNDPSKLFRLVPLRKARPEDLADRARELIERLGYAEPPAGSASGLPGGPPRPRTFAA